MMRYGETFFDNQKEGSIASARHIVPIVIDFVAPKSVIDIGCGLGTWLAVFREHGIENIFGIDGPWVNQEKLYIPKEWFRSADLERIDGTDLSADLAVCLEVGEHLPASAAEHLIDTLTHAAPVVLFSAAIPFQGGTHHVNEQWPAYWTALFKKRGFVPIDCVRRRVWEDAEVEFWYAQNTFVYVREDALARYPKLRQEIEMGFGTTPSLVHPAKFLYVAERYRLIAPFIAALPGPLVRKVKRLLSAARRAGA